jgi:hypothetical protein
VQAEATEDEISASRFFRIAFVTVRGVMDGICDEGWFA